MTTEGLIRLIVLKTEPSDHNHNRFESAVEGGLTTERVKTLRKWLRVMWKTERLSLVETLAACGSLS